MLGDSRAAQPDGAGRRPRRRLRARQLALRELRSRSRASRRCTGWARSRRRSTTTSRCCAASCGWSPTPPTASALGTFAKKQAALQNQATPDPIPDWSRETPRTTRLPALPPEVAVDPWLAHVRTLSDRAGPARADPLRGVDHRRPRARATASTARASRRWRRSRRPRCGSRPRRRPKTACRCATASTVHARTVAGLPAPADLATRARELAAGLVALRKAPVGEAYTGPVLVEGQAAVRAARPDAGPAVPDAARAGDGEPADVRPRWANAPSSPFLTRVGNRVLPESFTATRHARRWRSSRAGRWRAPTRVDDEGIPAQDVTLCEKGLLKSLLTSRTPQKGFLTSNGHGRGGIAAGGGLPAAVRDGGAGGLAQGEVPGAAEGGRPDLRLHRPRARAGRAEPGGDPEDMMIQA